MKKTCLIVIVGIYMFGCQKTGDAGTLFQKVDPQDSGIDFANELTFDQEFNIYTYRNYYNGGGVAIGDINNDGLADIYFTANLKPNKLYLNKGDFNFEDISVSSGTIGKKAWSTGVTMADVNADGLLDIYVCNSGDIKGDSKQNELYINNGDLTFTESAEIFGLADQGFSTHASFFDFDKDGDLDAYILNNSYQSIASFDLRRNERPERDKLGGDKLMENIDGKFIDISEKAGIYGSIIGFGLGVTVGDMNGDTWDDIYVSNDFFERDYLYINNQDGTFKEDLTSQMNSISGASMGADMADINNDGSNDLFVTEMLPSDYDRLKTVTTFEDWNRYQYGVENGYYHQFTRNTFQLNNGNNSFSEVSRLAGVEATDWSWGALMFDFDNNGYRDLFVANGIYQDLTNQDYLQYVSNEQFAKSVISNSGVDYSKLVDIIPSNPIPNHAFYNDGNLNFENSAEKFGLAEPGFSNGAAYGDLDNDGDLDLVVNNVNMPAWIFRNNSTGGNYLKLELKGEGKNTYAIGTKIHVRSGAKRYYVEQQPVRGFQSSMEPIVHLGLESDLPVDIEVIWPTGKRTVLKSNEVNKTLRLSEKDAEESSDKDLSESKAIFVKTKSPDYMHNESEFIDFHRDRLMPHMQSTMGPRISSADINGDGQEDFYIGGAKTFSGRFLVSSPKGFIIEQPDIFVNSSISEDQESVFFDLENDGDLDLYVCSGGVEFSQSSSALFDRLYINENGKWTSSDQLLPNNDGFISSSTVSAADIDGDGDIDLFVGEQAKPTKYGIPGSGFILINEEGQLINRTKTILPELEDIGMIRDSEFADLDDDGDVDLIVTGEFMGIHIFKNDQGKFTMESADLTTRTGWWNRVSTVDIDKDGDLDLIVGNHGLNSRFKASESSPITLFLGDFDKNGSLDPIMGKQMETGRTMPYDLRHNLIDQIKSLKKLFPDYESFKGVSIEQMLGEEAIADAKKLAVTSLKSGVFRNQGNFKFQWEELPIEAQYSPVYAISSGDYDKDGDLDLLIGGNLFATKPEVGRYDASKGSLLLNDGLGKFTSAQGGLGFSVNGEIREIITLKDKILVGRNSDSLVVFSY